MIDVQSNTLADTLAVQFRMLAGIAGANLEGITHEESLVRATPTSNNLNWIIGHIVSTRCALLPALRQEPVWGDEETRLYRRGSGTALDPEFLPFDEVLRAFKASQDRILAGIASLTEEELAAPAPFSPGGGPETLATLLMKCTIHEGYHLGQTGILRRVTGKPGAIR